MKHLLDGFSTHIDLLVIRTSASSNIIIIIIIIIIHVYTGDLPATTVDVMGGPVIIKY